MRIGAICMLCMSRYVVHILGVQETEVIRVQRLCCVSSIRFKVYKIWCYFSRAVLLFFLHFQYVVYIFVFRFIWREEDLYLIVCINKSNT